MSINLDSKDGISVIANALTLVATLKTLMEMGDLKRARVIIRKSWNLYSTAEGKKMETAKQTAEFVVDEFFWHNGDMAAAWKHMREAIPDAALAILDKKIEPMIKHCLEEALKMSCD